LTNFAVGTHPLAGPNL